MPCYHACQEIKNKFFGQGTAPVGKRGQNLFEAESQEAEKTFKNAYLFNNLELEQDQSYGQRGFGRNMEKILSTLLKFYNKYYNKQGS